MGCSNCQPEIKTLLHSKDSNDFEDDVWGDDDVYVDANADVKRAHQKQGYLDGLASAQESSLQSGFDKAFSDGARMGAAVGKILGELRALGESELFYQATKELNIAKIMDKKYFDSELKIQKNHEVIYKWQKIVAQHLEDATKA